MSFDKKIREKLVNHIPKYDSGSWESFSKMLPAPWYTRLFQSSSGWIVGGLSTTALLFTLYTYNTKTELLNGEITTLKSQIENTAPGENQIITRTDTVYITKEIEKPIYVNQVAANDNALKAANDKISSLTKKIAILNKRVSGKEVINPLNGNVIVTSNQTSAKTGNTESKINQKADGSIINNSEIKDGSKAQHSVVLNEKVDVNDIDVKNSTLVLDVESVHTNESQIDPKNSLKVIDKELADADLPKESLVVPELKAPVEELVRLDPDEPKKKINWPKMRFGLSSEYLGLKVLATGPTAEVFLFDKLSFNASALFSGQIETKHPFPRDFNFNTGKEFNEEFRKYLEQKPALIEDITIKTSFVKLPLYFNYYINTWSRFSFMVSAGTKLDLSVYQDVDYFVGPFGQQINRRFEAKPKPKTFNNLFYGMGVQYKYKKFVGQLTPYFDFTFRDADYFKPNKSFGINGSLKFEFGK
jgi:hypothetical protein